MKTEYIEKIYAGWLSKIIGIRYGAPVEGWDYDKIRELYGDSLQDYPVSYKTFAADDDSNGPLFFLHALEDAGILESSRELQPQDVASALLNYAPYEHGFFWWGGYGVSTEHTAYLNLRNGIQAPDSGSIQLNGTTMAEQIGGQIFVDTWGFVNPGKPERAAAMARAAASVTHDGDGLNGAAFVAACISAAFEKTDIRTIIETGLSFVDKGNTYEKVVRDVMAFYDQDDKKKDPESFRKCYEWIRTNYGYDKYPGICHIIPNIAVMILALCYGNGDYERTLEICNLCGWDTDCNVGNVASIMGVRGGLEAIPWKWRKSVNDLLISSCVMGSMNIGDIPEQAAYMARIAYRLDGENFPEEWGPVLDPEPGTRQFHFQYPGSTHSMHLALEPSGAHPETRQFQFRNRNQSLELRAPGILAGETLYLYHKTMYVPADFNDSRYDPAFSPILYPGQTVSASFALAERNPVVKISLYVKDLDSGKVLEGRQKLLQPGEKTELEFSIPTDVGSCIQEAGLCIRPMGQIRECFDLTANLMELKFSGKAFYHLDCAQAVTERWQSSLHEEIRPFTRLKGNVYVQEGGVHVSCADYGQIYTGDREWTDYQVVYEATLKRGRHFQFLARVQGSLRYVGAALLSGNRFALIQSQKDEHGHEILKETPYAWKSGDTVRLQIQVKDQELMAKIQGNEGQVEEQLHTTLIKPQDGNALTKGAIGVGVLSGSHMILKSLDVKPC